MLSFIAARCFTLSMMPAVLGVPGYLAPMILITAGYALFQKSNNTAVMNGIQADRRGVVSGMLNLSRNLGLITGASVMGALFAFVSATTDIAIASPATIATGMQVTFAVAATLMTVAVVIAVAGHRAARGPLMP